MEPKNLWLNIDTKSADYKSADWEMVFIARPSTEDKDVYNEITNGDAFVKAMPEYMKNPVVMFNHDYEWTIGKVIEFWHDDISPVVKIGIAKTDKGKEVATLIRAGVVTKMSFMFGNTQYVKDDDTGVNYLVSFKIYEIGPVSIPANIEAGILEVEKSANIKLSNIRKSFLSGGGQKGKDTRMDPEVKKAIDELEKKLGHIPDAIDKQKSLIDTLQKTVDDQEQLKKLVSDEAERLAKGLITNAEFKTATDKIAEDILKMQQKIDTALNADRHSSNRFPAKDWRGLLNSDYVWLRGENNEALPSCYQKMYSLMQAPVKLDSDEGHVVKLMRDAYDALLIHDVMMNSSHCPTALKRQYKVENLKTFQQVVKLIGHFDPEFAKAMYSTGTGVGDEWVMTGWSSQLIDLINIAPSIANIFPTVQMTQNPQLFLLKSSRSSAYVAGEAATNNPDVLKKSNFGTSQGQFSTFTLAVHSPISPEFIEDAAINVVEEVRKDTVEAQMYAKDSLVCNGDTTATHRDTNQSYVLNVDPETKAMGLRYTAIDDSAAFDSQSTTAGVGDATAAFHEKDCRYLLGLLTPKFATQPNKLHYIVNVRTWILMKSFEAVADASRNGIRSTWGNGTLDQLDGSPIHITEALSKDLNASGVDTGSAADHSCVLLVHEDGFNWGQKRDITLEYDKDIRTQQLGFVTTQRIDFKKKTLSTVKPVAMAYNIETP